MFEGLVRQLLVGYLGRYVKDIQKEQLKITLWNEEVFLENVELILEAFDYLQLPFALKQGRVGKLSIKIPWKKLGWDPIIISLEDVFISAGQRNDQEWSSDAVEKREFAGKRAKLAAAELAKLSRCVCDNRSGQSFMSYITAKILDSIQVSIRDFHVLYSDKQIDSEQIVLGLKFSSLTIMKQNPSGPFGSVRANQVNKIVHIIGFEIYYCKFVGVIQLTSMNNAEDFKIWSNKSFRGNEYDHILAPFDMLVSLLVNRSGRLENDAPQYSITAEVTGLVISLDDVQLQHILVLWDYLCTCQIREKYGRYYPWSYPLSRKYMGWQKVWWHYAIESVLFDVRKKLQKTSWRYLGERLSRRRKYVELYKRKLDFIRMEQSIDEGILRELERMEQEYDVDDILSYRSAAESALKDSLLTSPASNVEANSSNNFIQRSRNDENSSGRSRGWLNWLSRGMLGAGGTDDSSQFSGVVSDEVIKDIYEATKFDPAALSNEDMTANDKIYRCSISFTVHQISATVRSKNSAKEVAELTLIGMILECKLWDELATIITNINSGKMVHPSNKNVVILLGRLCADKPVLENEQPSCRVQVDLSPNREVGSSVKVALQPLEVTCDAEFLLNFMEIFDGLEFFNSQHGRVMSSINGIEDVHARLISKSEYAISNRRKVMWDFSILNFIINVPWTNGISAQFKMVLELGDFHFASKLELGILASCAGDQSYVTEHFGSPKLADDILTGLRLKDLYDNFEIKLNDVELKIVTTHHLQTPILENFHACITLASSIIPDESILKQLEVYVFVSPLHVHFSPSMYKSVLQLITHMDVLYSRSQSVLLENHKSSKITSKEPGTVAFGFSGDVNFESVKLHIELENDEDNSSSIMLSLREIDIRYSKTEHDDCWICVKGLKVVTHQLRSEISGHVLCSSGNMSASETFENRRKYGGLNDLSKNFSEKNIHKEKCFCLHYEANNGFDMAWKKWTVFLDDADFHCYPNIIASLVDFYDRMSAYTTAYVGKNSSGSMGNAKRSNKIPCSGLQKFGFSNFLETESSEYASISLESFPFITIRNSGDLCNPESSVLYPDLDWRKYFGLRDSKIRSPNCSTKKCSKTCDATYPKSSSTMSSYAVSDSGNSSSFTVDFCWQRVRIHFHDSSCLVGTITLPTCQSSLFINEGSMNLLCSIEGLVLTSLWCNQNFCEFLWGPTSPNLSPILNILVRTENGDSLSSRLEVNIGIQHVCCILPPLYLAIIIGYFSLPDWRPNSREQCGSDNHKFIDEENESAVIYKFEILDSTLTFPVDSDEQQFLRLKIPQLYTSFITECMSNTSLNGIASECLLPSHKVAERSDCLNIFARDLFLSFGFCKDETYDCIDFEHDTCEMVQLFAPLSADIWIRLPCESEAYVSAFTSPTCIMARIRNCQLSADDCYFFYGFEALMDVVEKFYSVHDESKGFKSNVLQFLQSRMCPEKDDAPSQSISEVIFTEIRCQVDSFLLVFHRSSRNPVLLEPVAKIEMQLIFYASLRNATPSIMDCSFTSLALYSLLNSVVLAQCSFTCSSTPVLNILLSTSGQDEIELSISLPSLDIWLHILDWTMFIDLCNSYSGKLSDHAPQSLSSKDYSIGMVDVVADMEVTDSQSPIDQSSISTYTTPENVKKGNVILTARSDNIGIVIHFPIWISEQLRGEVHERTHSSPSDVFEGKDYRLVVITTHSRSCELFIVGRKANFKFSLGKTSGSLVICEDKSVNSYPFFQIFQFHLETEIINNQAGLVNANVEVRSDWLDVWLSHQVLYFWSGVVFKVPEAGSSHSNSIDFKIEIRKVSILLTDGRWSCSRPLLELLLKNFLLHADLIEHSMESSFASDLEVNYNNIHKVLWEPFVEPWKFQINMTRKLDTASLLSNSMVTDIYIKSMGQLNLNVTESLIECVFRTTEMINEAWGVIEPNELPEQTMLLNPQTIEDICAGRYAPYILQNLTSLPLVYCVSQGQRNSDELDVLEMDAKSVQPGCSVPIYLSENPDEQLFRYRPTQYSERLSEKQIDGVAHHFMTIRLDGASVPSSPISMDLVGLTCFEIDFSNASYEVETEKGRDASNYNMNSEDNGKNEGNMGFSLPVVFDVSVQLNSKLIRLYSTVILLNATSLPLEIRFDIPFGVSPKILDPIYPGQEFPLPLHLAEAGRIMCRPLGKSYPWSGVHNLSNILSLESKIGFHKSFVCYPSQLSNDPFRCCISVQNTFLPSSGRPKKGSSLCTKDTLKKNYGQRLNGMDKSKKRFIHQVTLSTPLVVNNYLPEPILLTIESGGISCNSLLSEVQTHFHHIDPSHDLVLEFHMHETSSVLNFPRTETFSTIAKFSGTKFSVSETIIFKHDLNNGPIHVAVEKIMDGFSGARELYIFVPFLLYNCTGFPLIISESGNERQTGCTIPSCYKLVEHEILTSKKDGLSLFSSGLEVPTQHINSTRGSFSDSHIVSLRKNVDPHLRSFIRKPLIGQRNSVYGLNNKLASIRQLTNSDFIGNEPGKVKPCMYSPSSISPANEIVVRARRCLDEHASESVLNSSWSGPFFLIPPSDSTNVLVPILSSNSASMISVTSSALTSPFAGRTRAIIFQPRYVICNACNKELCYKQKATDLVYHFGIGQHSHLQWTDTTRELLISVRFNEPGCQWSGSFLPDHLGDTQVKMRNYLSGALNMIRVEVQNADVSIGDEKIVGNLHGNSGTNLILISDDHTGYMPYRIDNFSKERLRIYQQKCETFDTIVQPHNSCPYAWDEPCYPHRLCIEVPGERVLGLYSIDEVKDCMPIYLRATSENPERTLLLSVHAEGAIKVLSIVDPSYHILNDIDPEFTNKKTREKKHEKLVDYKEKISVVVPYVGVSVISSYPQELIYLCAKSITIDLLQSLDQQKLSFHISSLQIDNQFRATPYPVILSFDREYRSNPTSLTFTGHDAGRTKMERTSQISTNSSTEPVFYLAVAKWRNKDSSLVSFEYIIARVADFRLELELELILSLFDFLRTVSSNFQDRVPFPDAILDHRISGVGLKTESASYSQSYENLKAREDQLYAMIGPSFNKNHKRSTALPSIVPIGAPWQQIYLLARRQKKVYVELFDLAPIKLSLSFSSAPWMLRNGLLASGESLIHRGLMALADVEGARINLKELTIAHQLASREAIQEILIRHYTRQFLHEVYKVFGSAGVIGNPMGFARSLGVGISDFLSVPARSFLQSPTGLITGMAQGTTSLVSNTVYAISDAATQFSKAAHKGIVAFTFDDQAVARMEKQQQGVPSQSKGVINELLEGFTGLLQSPIKGAEKHGLPGVLSGMALGVTGLVARPAASLLEVTGRTAQSIRNRSRVYQMGPQHYRVRFPRPLSRELPLMPYSWEEAIGTSMLVEADDGFRFRDEVLVMCKALKQDGKFVVITERFILIASCSSLVDLGKPEFQGIAVDLKWVIESEIGLDSVIHVDTDDRMVHIVGSGSDALSTQSQSKRGSGTRTKRWNIPTPLPLSQTNLELKSKDDAVCLLKTLLSTFEQGKERGCGSGYVLHQSKLMKNTDIRKYC